ncbi:uncharacterized protein FIBRA_07065 [Fibroporia radiculosa]|uniref:Major facilitator superfamily (MFS) profile domain-containing protein n=1 Tax=Fibroporia radiculosa TaxID=599839 RepID=J4I038_9APHY|nr:uncharacterized protein FIBRA_07065 [Fibroporia radiculosa]CCM04872.1 predicted protein [Fibroporia radiculosa]
MASLIRRESVDEKSASPVQEKQAFEASVQPVFESAYDKSQIDGDGALELVGFERTQEFSDEYNRKLLRKLDFIIPPICAAVYFTQFLDKTSLNYASIMGLPIKGQDYNLISLAFYAGILQNFYLVSLYNWDSAGFLVWEFPSVYISQKFPVAKFLGINVLLWGAVVMLHAVAKTFSQFFALRFLLGMCESCVSPILVLIISMFYKKEEQGKRVAAFYNGLTQIFGGCVAYGVAHTHDPNLVSYKIIYILLGGLAIIVGVVVLLFLPDSPVHARLLTKEERIAALERVRDGQVGTENKHWKKDQIFEALMDVRTWLIILTVMLTSIPSGGLTNFSNQIIESFGYSTEQTLILSTPGGAIFACMIVFCGWYSDRKNDRMVPIVICLIPTIVGAAMLIGLNGRADEKGALLFGIYLTSTFGSALSSVYAYNASNTSGHTKKNTINSLTMVAFGVGNILGTEIFQPADAPAYIPGKIAIMVLLTTQLFLSFLIRWINQRLNSKRLVALAEAKARNGWTDEDVQKERERHAFLDLTDKQNLFFVYTT